MAGLLCDIGYTENAMYITLQFTGATVCRIKCVYFLRNCLPFYGDTLNEPQVTGNVSTCPSMVPGLIDLFDEFIKMANTF